MQPVIVWVLVVLGPHAGPVETFPTLGQCVQARSDYGYTSSPQQAKRRNQPLARCRDQVRWVKPNPGPYRSPSM